jgi:N-acetylglutamate synthase-like GNAT family acetyltransferase
MQVLKKVNELFPQLFFKPKNLHIRKASNADVFEIINLIREVKLEHKIESNTKTESMDLLNIQHYFKEGIFLVAEDEGRIVATAAIKIKEDKTSKLSRLFVQRAYRKNGIGSELLQMLIQHAKIKEASFIQASFSKSWKKAEKHLENAGFTKIYDENHAGDKLQMIYDFRH